jgi:hypothetical protein
MLKCDQCGHDLRVVFLEGSAIKTTDKLWEGVGVECHLPDKTKVVLCLPCYVEVLYGLLFLMNIRHFAFLYLRRNTRLSRMNMTLTRSSKYVIATRPCPWPYTNTTTVMIISSMNSGKKMMLRNTANRVFGNRPLITSP